MIIPRVGSLTNVLIGPSERLVRKFYYKHGARDGF